MIEQTDQEWITILDDAALGQIARNSENRLQDMAKAEMERRDAAYLAIAEDDSPDVGRAIHRESNTASSSPSTKGIRIENACCCGAAGTPCEWWVARNAQDRLQNLEYLACGILQLLRLRRTDFMLSHTTQSHVEGLRLRRLAENMQCCGVEYLSYAPCCDAGPLEKVLVDRLSEIVAAYDDPEWIKEHRIAAETFDLRKRDAGGDADEFDIYRLSKKHLAAMVAQYKAWLKYQQANTAFTFALFGERIQFEMQPVEWEIIIRYGSKPVLIKKSDQFDGYWSIAGEAFEPPVDLPNAFPVLENGVFYWQSSPKPMDDRRWELVFAETQDAPGDPGRSI